MNRRFNRIKKRVVEDLELPKDIMLNIPRILMEGDNEITIENHKGIILFEENEIKMNTSIGILTINGKCFEIMSIIGETLVINGTIFSICYDGREK